jgi:putative effector of murein hydrolase
MSDSTRKSLIKASTWFLGAFTLCFLAGGWFCWQGSYQEYMAAGVPLATLLLLAVTAFALPLVSGAGIIPCGIVVGATFPAVVMVRVVLDGMNNPTDHNLWPFEVAIASAIGMGIALPAAAIGGLIRRVMHRNSDNRQ